MTTEQKLQRLVRNGIVTDVNNDKRLARVKFPDTGVRSGWLYVLDNRPYIPDYDVPQRTETQVGGSGEEAFEEHYHDLIIKPWMPKVNDQVLTLYLPSDWDADGFVLGKIGT